MRFVPLFGVFKREYSYGDFEMGLGDGQPFIKLWQEKEGMEGEETSNPIITLSDIHRKMVINLPRSRFIREFIHNSKVFKRGFGLKWIIWKTIIGLDDPMNTAIISGSLWGIKAFILATLKDKIPIDNAKFEVSPSFDSTTLYTKIKAEGHLHVIHLIPLVIWKIRELNFIKGRSRFFYISRKTLT
ncbi:MAG: DUF2953 domain-containing protein [Chitinophagales bacterium]